MYPSSGGAAREFSGGLFRGREGPPVRGTRACRGAGERRAPAVCVAGGEAPGAADCSPGEALLDVEKIYTVKVGVVESKSSQNKNTDDEGKIVPRRPGTRKARPRCRPVGRERPGAKRGGAVRAAGSPGVHRRCSREGGRSGQGVVSVLLGVGGDAAEDVSGSGGPSPLVSRVPRGGRGAEFPGRLLSWGSRGVLRCGVGGVGCFGLRRTLPACGTA